MWSESSYRFNRPPLEKHNLKWITIFHSMCSFLTLLSYTKTEWEHFSFQEIYLTTICCNFIQKLCIHLYLCILLATKDRTLFKIKVFFVPICWETKGNLPCVIWILPSRWALKDNSNKYVDKHLLQDYFLCLLAIATLSQPDEI